MDRAYGTKMKMVKLLELLRTQTDEAHPMCTKDIIKYLEEIGLKCDRRTIYRDIKILNEYGYEVMTTRIGHDMAYYIADRGFSLPEIKLLIDAVLAASFLTEKKTQELVGKLSSLGGTHQGALLVAESFYANKRKHSNESIYYSIDQIQTALQSKKMVSCYYFYQNENHEKVYQKDKARYFLEPYALVIRDDNYYLLTYNAKYEATTTYRVDRMEDVRVEETPISSTARSYQEHVSDHLREAFHMYSGEPQWVVLRFEASLITAIYDTFGEETQIRSYPDGTYEARVQVQVAPTFWGWLFQFGGKMEIAYPQSLVLAFHRQMAPFLPPAAREALEKEDAQYMESQTAPKA